MELTQKYLAGLYASIRRIRRAEEVIADIYPTDAIKSPVHLSIGQEHVAAVVCSMLTTNDLVNATYRSHAAFLAKGGSMNSLFAEMYGKVTGCCKGKGGSMHLANMAQGFMGTSAVVGTGIPNATGAALTQQYKKTGNIVVCFFGDGATEEGAFYESLNFAAVRKLPILYVCENNGYAIHTPIAKRRAQVDLAWIAESLGVHAKEASNSLTKLCDITHTAIAHVRAERGPYFMEVPVGRWREHVGPKEDYDQGYRAPEELNYWKIRDPLNHLSQLLPEKIVVSINEAVEAEVEEAVRFAEESPVPEQGELHSNVYA